MFRVMAASGCLMLMMPGAPLEAKLSCSPKFAGARILLSKNQNDLHPDWKPPAQIGMAWSLIAVRDEGANYASGVLVSPRGGEVPGRVVVLRSEWDCADY